LFKNTCFVGKVQLNNRLINNIQYLQEYYRNHKINNKKEIQKRIKSEQNYIFTKEYKNNSMNIESKTNFLFKPNNKIL